MNEELRRAFDSARLDEVDVASKIGVDPKTVRRWLRGRVPLRRHRWLVADMLKCDERDLWPELGGGRRGPVCPEVVGVYPHRGAVPHDVWCEFFASAERDIGVLVYSGLFLAEDVDVRRVLAERARAGVAVRVLLGDPECPRVAERGAEEGIADAMAAKIRNAIVLCEPLREVGAEVRLHHTVLYNSIYRADDEMLVNPHVYGAAAAHAPVLYLRQSSPGDLVTTYVESFERVWADAASPV